eukprot:gene4057-8065_t
MFGVLFRKTFANSYLKLLILTCMIVFFLYMHILTTISGISLCLSMKSECLSTGATYDAVSYQNTPVCHSQTQSRQCISDAFMQSSIANFDLNQDKISAIAIIEKRDLIPFDIVITSLACFGLILEISLVINKAYMNDPTFLGSFLGLIRMLMSGPIPLALAFLSLLSGKGFTTINKETCLNNPAVQNGADICTFLDSYGVEIRSILNGRGVPYKNFGSFAVSLGVGLLIGGAMSIWGYALAMPREDFTDDEEGGGGGGGGSIARIDNHSRLELMTKDWILSHVNLEGDGKNGNNIECPICLRNMLMKPTTPKKSSVVKRRSSSILPSSSLLTGSNTNGNSNGIEVETVLSSSSLDLTVPSLQRIQYKDEETKAGGRTISSISTPTDTENPTSSSPSTSYRFFGSLSTNASTVELPSLSISQALSQSLSASMSGHGHGHNQGLREQDTDNNNNNNNNGEFSLHQSPSSSGRHGGGLLSQGGGGGGSCSSSTHGMVSLLASLIPSTSTGRTAAAAAAAYIPSTSIPIPEIPALDNDNGSSSPRLLRQPQSPVDSVPSDYILAQLPCGHIFHKHCVLEWARRHDTCPVCRADLTGPGPHRDRDRDSSTTTAAAARRSSIATPPQVLL